MAATAKPRYLGDMPEAFMGLLQAQVKWGQQVYEELTGTKAPTYTDALSAWGKGWPPAARAACYVPPPCWMPRALADCVGYAGCCSSASVRIVVTNCDRVVRTVSVRGEGVNGAKGVSVTPPSVNLQPLHRATFEVKFHVPEHTEDGKQFESLIWVEGCNTHVMRWTVIAGSGGIDSCHEVTVDDCPDYRHHWYDHFYCKRPCPSIRPTANG